MKTEDLAQRDVQYYLRAWRRWVRSWTPALGYPHEAPFVKHMVPVVSWDSSEDQLAQADEADQQVAEFVLRAVDTEVEALATLKRAAVRLIYLNETAPAVFRSGRMSLERAAYLCEVAELEMIPGLRLRGVILGGY